RPTQTRPVIAMRRTAVPDSDSPSVTRPEPVTVLASVARPLVPRAATPAGTAVLRSVARTPVPRAAIPATARLNTPERVAVKPAVTVPRPTARFASAPV